MATHPLTPIDESITSEIHLAVRQQALLNKLLQRQNDLDRISPYYIPTKCSNLLARKNIPHSTEGVLEHPHPANKRIEEHIMFNLIKYLLAKDSELWYSKEQKARKLLNEATNIDSLLLKNKVHEVKDLKRYNSPEHNVDILDTAERECLVLHDCLHYFSPDDVLRIFQNSPNLKTIVATAIIPAESKYRYESIYPELYKLKYTKNTLTYIPEDDYAGAYEQPISALVWLNISHIITGSIKLTVDVETDLCAHKVITIHRGFLQTKSYYRASGNGFGVLPNLFSDQRLMIRKAIPYKMIYDLFTYVQSIKTLNEVNARAKLRLQTSGNKSPIMNPTQFNMIAKMAFIYAVRLNEIDPWTTLEQDVFLKRWKHRFSNLFKTLTLRRTSEDQDLFLIDLLTPKELEFNFKRKIYRSKVTRESSDENTLYHDSPGTFLYKFLDTLDSLKKVEDLDDLDKLLTTWTWGKPIEAAEETYQDFIRDGASSFYSFTSEDQPIWESGEIFDDSRSEASTTLSVISSNAPPETTEGPAIQNTIITDGSVTVHSITHQTIEADAINEQGEEEEELLTFENGFDNFQADNGWAEQAGLDIEGNANPKLLKKIQDDEDLEDEEIEEIQAYEQQTEALKYRAVKKYIQQALKSGKGCGLKALLGIMEQGILIKAIAAIVQQDANEKIETELGGNLCKQLRRTGLNKFCSLTTLDILYITQVAGLKVNLHCYSTEVKKYICIHTGSLKNIYHHGNHHWTNKPGSHEACTVIQNTNAKIVLKQTNIIPMQEGDNQKIADMVQKNMEAPQYLYFPKYKIVKEAQNEYKDFNFKNVKPGGFNIEELAKIIDEKVEKYQPTVKRADLYMRDLKNGATGTLRQNHFKKVQSMDAMVNSRVARKPVKIIARIGRGGCRKTQGLLDYVERKENGINTYTVVVPRTSQRREWNGKLKHERKYTVKTFETALLESPAEAVIFDEVSQLPPGYIDAFLRIHSHVTQIVLLFDLIQTQFHEPNPESTLNRQVKEEAHFSGYGRFYHNYTFRSTKEVAAFLGYKTYSNVEGRIATTNSFDPAAKILACDDVSTKTILSTGYSASTISSSQGDTYYQKLQIFINGAGKMASEEVLNTAITRAAGDVEFVFSENQNEVDLERRYATNPFLRALLSGQHLQSSCVKKISYEEIQELDENFLQVTKTVPVNPDEALARLIAPLKDKSEREVKVDGKLTDQIKETRKLATQIFLKHTQKDEATMKLSVQKRLTITTSSRVKRKFYSEGKRKLGKTLFEAFKRGLSLDDLQREWDEDLFLTCVEEYYHKKINQKDLATLKNNVDRAIADDGVNKIHIFLKGQTCGKLEKMYSDAKAGQTIACFKDAALICLAPLALYIEKKIFPQIPEQFYIHTKKTAKDFNKWVKENFKEEVQCTENDYERYDQSQGAECLWFEVYLMRHLNIPEDFIEFYIFLKLNAETQFGLLDIMRLTGEWATFLFNTFVNMAYTFLKYKDFRRKIEDRPAAAFGGDDMVVYGILTVCEKFLKIAHLFEIKSKLNFTNKPVFCGWRLTPGGIYKSPKLLFAKLMAKATSEDLLNSIVGYTYDAIFAYANYQRVSEYFEEEDHYYHSALTRFLVRSGMKLNQIAIIVLHEQTDITPDIMYKDGDRDLEKQLENLVQYGNFNYSKTREQQRDNILLYFKGILGSTDINVRKKQRAQQVKMMYGMLNKESGGNQAYFA